jgi:hypothetical protein
MLEPVRSWSLADHMHLVSGWSAKCRNRSPMSCHSDLSPYTLERFDQAVDQELATGTTTIDLAWTDITWLLYAHHISWAYYVQNGIQPDSRPDVRENEPILGNLTADFDFGQNPRPPLLLPTNPPTDSPSIPPYFSQKPRCRGCPTPPPARITGTWAGAGQ